MRRVKPIVKRVALVIGGLALVYQKRDEERKGGDIFFKSTEPQDDLAAYRANPKKSSKSSN
jgi:hypothetical protein